MKVINPRWYWSVIPYCENHSCQRVRRLQQQVRDATWYGPAGSSEGTEKGFDRVGKSGDLRESNRVGPSLD